MKIFPEHEIQVEKLASENAPAVLPADNLRTIAGLYRLCALSMRFPEKRWFTRDYLTCLFELLEKIGGTGQKRELEQAIVLSDLHLESLQVEYTRLFINANPHVVAPPYASVYLDRSLQGHYTGKILSFYTSRGFAMDEGSDLPDHIVHQLEFLALLAESGDQNSEAEFLTKLFLPWFRVFLPRVVQESQHPFYRIVVQIIDYFTKEEDEHDIQGIEA